MSILLGVLGAVLYLALGVGFMRLLGPFTRYDNPYGDAEVDVMMTAFGIALWPALFVVGVAWLVRAERAGLAVRGVRHAARRPRLAR